MNKNILVLSPTPSHPQDAGNRKRIYALTKYLQELGATIYFVYCPREWDREIPQDGFEGMNQCWDYFFVAYPVQPAVHRTDDEYFELDAWWDVGIEFAVNWIKRSAEIDMVLCNYVFYSKVLELFDSGVTKVIDTHDIVSNRNYLLDKKLGYRDFFYVSPESEQKALDRADLILSIKEDEASWFKCLSKTPVLTIGHLEPPSAIAPKNIDYSNIKLGFIGSSNPINVRNLESFLDEYLLAYGQYSQLTFIVGGKVCDALDARFKSKIQILGKVKDISEFYELIDIIVLPFEFSTGLKIKTVEALSWSKPCIGTINAFEGLGTKSKYHSYKTIKELAHGVEAIVKNPQITLPKLQEDSEFVYSHYTNKVKQSIEKLYQANWKSIKKLQTDSGLNIASEIESSNQIKVYSFNIITNVDFWYCQTNEQLWLKFWIDKARELGCVNIYRTKNFQNIETDKLELYKLGLVDDVHYRELYQVIERLNTSVKQNQDQIHVDLIDFNSIIFNQACLNELDHFKLGSDRFLLYFIDLYRINLDSVILQNLQHLLKTESNHNFCLWDSDVSSTVDLNLERSRNKNIFLTEHPVRLNHTDLDDLEQIVIGISCLNSDNQAELNKFIFSYQNFLPQHFKLIVFSDLELNADDLTICPLKNAAQLIPSIDLFICIEDPPSISFLLYLCQCDRIPIYAKNEKFAQHNGIETIKNFNSIPETYRSFIEQSIWMKSNSNQILYDSWQDLLIYLLDKAKQNSIVSADNYSLIS